MFTRVACSAVLLFQSRGFYTRGNLPKPRHLLPRITSPTFQRGGNILAVSPFSQFTRRACAAQTTNHHLYEISSPRTKISHDNQTNRVYNNENWSPLNRAAILQG
jgi:hypothetical protein